MSTSLTLAIPLPSVLASRAPPRPAKTAPPSPCSLRLARSTPSAASLTRLTTRVARRSPRAPRPSPPARRRVPPAHAHKGSHGIRATDHSPPAIGDRCFDVPEDHVQPPRPGHGPEADGELQHRWAGNHLGKGVNQPFPARGGELAGLTSSRRRVTTRPSAHGAAPRGGPGADRGTCHGLPHDLRPDMSGARHAQTGDQAGYSEKVGPVITGPTSSSVLLGTFVPSLCARGDLNPHVPKDTGT